MSGGLLPIGAAILLLAGGAVALTAGPPGPRSRLSVVGYHRNVRQWVGWRVGVRAQAVFTVSGAALVGGAWAGPVAAVFAGVYAWLAARARARGRAAWATEHGAAVAQDLVTGLAADLRGGLAPVVALEWGVRTVLATADGGPPAAGSGPRHPGVRAQPHPGRMPSPGVTSRLEPPPPPGPGPHRSTGRGHLDQGPPPAGGRFAPVLAAAATGGDVPAALRATDLPGGKDALMRLAAAWEVADSVGAPLADVLDRLDTELGSLRRRRARMRAETAAASATSRMLALLPLLGLGLGYALGADPLHTLLHSAVGSVSALLALGLQVAGLLWAEHLTSASERVTP
ncbi:MAG: tight adherence protein [Actinomycetota bacterium]|nr:tight adherence protein [Actinomycetota bacterium]